MSEAEFISMHVNGGESIGGNLHLNLNPTIQAIGAAQSRVSGIAIGETAFSVNNTSTGQSINLESVLEQIERIQFSFPTNGSILNFDVAIENRNSYSGPTHDPFYYFQTGNIIIPYNADLLDYQQIEVTISPFLLNIQFINSTYNPLIGNGLVNRKSQERVESDRTEDNVLPTNWNAILSGSAPFATVQDSLYYDTGWIRARYEGTKIRSTGNTSVEPAISGTPFTGEVFTYDTEDSFICSTTREKVSIEEMLHTSTVPLPVFTTSSLEVDVSGLRNTSIETVSYVPVEIGDILLMTGTGIYELIRALGTSIQIPGSTDYSIIVERGYAGTTKYTGNTGNLDPLKRVLKFDIFKLEQQTSEYLRLVNDSKILVQGNNTVIDTDKYGNLVREHICP